MGIKVQGFTRCGVMAGGGWLPLLPLFGVRARHVLLGASPLVHSPSSSFPSDMMPPFTNLLPYSVARRKVGVGRVRCSAALLRRPGNLVGDDGRVIVMRQWRHQWRADGGGSADQLHRQQTDSTSCPRTATVASSGSARSSAQCPSRAADAAAAAAADA